MVAVVVTVFGFCAAEQLIQAKFAAQHGRELARDDAHAGAWADQLQILFGYA